MKEIVAYTTTWCGPCKMLKPALNELVDEGYKITIIDPDESPEEAREAGVTSVPTLVFKEDGEVFDRTVGYMPKAKILEKLN
jgi:thioredoxin 1